MGDYYKLDNEDRLDIINYLWDVADDAKVFDDLTQSEKDLLKNYWVTVAHTAFNFTDGDYDLGMLDTGQGDPMYPTGTKWANNGSPPYWSPGWIADRLIYSLTLGMSVKMIIDNNHDTGICIAWARTYDSYYSKNTDTGEMSDNIPYEEYRADWVTDKAKPDYYSVMKPGAYIKNSDPGEAAPEYEALIETTDEGDIKYNGVDNDQKIILEAGNIHDGVSPADVTQGDGDVFGETIYYRLYDVDEGGKELVNDQIYRGGVDLPFRTDAGGTFKLVVKARSLGQWSEESVYYIHVGHKVTIDDGSGNEPLTTYYPGEAPVTISAMPQGDRFFVNWTAGLIDKDGGTVETDIAEALLGGKDKTQKAITTFTMPESGTDYAEGKKYPSKYGLVISAVCSDKIKETTLGLSAPVPETGTDPGHGLDDKTLISFDNGAEAQEYPVSWTYTYDGTTCMADDIVYSNADYTATVTIPQDKAKKIVFAPTDAMTAVYNGKDGDKIKENELSITRNDSDGSAKIVIAFKTTDDGGPVPPEKIVRVEIKKYDVTLNEYIDDGHYVGYDVSPGEVVDLIAPDADRQRFYMWDFDNANGIAPTDPGADLRSEKLDIKIPDVFVEDPAPYIVAQYSR